MAVNNLLQLISKDQKVAPLLLDTKKEQSEATAVIGTSMTQPQIIPTSNTLKREYMSGNEGATAKIRRSR